MSDPANLGEWRHNRLLATLEQLLAIDATELGSALDQASDLLVPALDADKIDAFLYDPSIATLVAAGTSHTPMGQKQIATGLNRLPVANGGRTVEVFTTGESYFTGDAHNDPQVLPGIREVLGVRSMLVVPLTIAGERRGVLSANSAKEDHFTEEDFRFLHAVARWVGMLAHRAELVESIKRHTAEQARRVTAEELVTVLAHDLGNRLTPAMGRIDMIRRRARRDSSEAYLQLAEAARQSLQSVTALINDLLDVSRLEQGLFSLTIAHVDLAAITRDTADMLRAPGANITARAPDELIVRADPARIRQVLENLIANAVKHGPPGVPVVLDLQVETREEGEWAVLSVRDEGPGIAPQLLPRLFTPFASGPGSTGLGIGLFLAHSIAQAHGGTLTVESVPGAGTTFRLSLPATGAQTAR